MIEENNLKSVLTILSALRPEELGIVGQENVENYLKDPMELSELSESSIAEFGVNDILPALLVLAKAAQTFIELFRLWRKASDDSSSRSESTPIVEVEPERDDSIARVSVSFQFEFRDLKSEDLRKLLAEVSRLTALNDAAK